VEAEKENMKAAFIYHSTAEFCCPYCAENIADPVTGSYLWNLDETLPLIFKCEFCEEVSKVPAKAKNLLLVGRKKEMSFPLKGFTLEAFKRGVEFIAYNDEPADLNFQSVQSYISTITLSETLRVGTDRIARAVLKLRRQLKD
jgi:hypothetical protein